jgi:KDO2-lipid IV(A) lauroyltransferase
VTDTDTREEIGPTPDGLRGRSGARPRGARELCAGQPTRGTDEDAREGEPRERRGTLFQRFRAWLVAIVSWIAVHLPETLVLRLADLAGDAWYRATPARAGVARANLGRVADALAARGQGSAAAIAAAGDPLALERLVRHAYRHAARYYLEVMRMPRLDTRMLRERLLIETPDVVERAFEDPEQPVVFVALHFGAIELPGLYLARRSGRPATAPMETLADPELQRWFVRTRGRVGVRIVPLEDARRELSAALRRREPVGLVADRDLTGTGLEIPLFDTPARLPVGPALLAIESGARVYVVAVRRAGPGRYRGQLREIEVVREGPRRQRLTGTMANLAAAFEASIAEAPEQWWAAFFPIWPDVAEQSAARTAALVAATSTSEQASRSEGVGSDAGPVTTTSAVPGVPDAPAADGPAAASVGTRQLPTLLPRATAVLRPVRQRLSQLPLAAAFEGGVARARPPVERGARAARPLLAAVRGQASRGIAAARREATRRREQGTPRG